MFGIVEKSKWQFLREVIILVCFVLQSKRKEKELSVNWFYREKRKENNKVTNTNTEIKYRGRERGKKGRNNFPFAFS